VRSAHQLEPSFVLITVYDQHIKSQAKDHSQVGIAYL
jgi:hypothetical protein